MINLNHEHSKNRNTFSIREKTFKIIRITIKGSFISFKSSPETIDLSRNLKSANLGCILMISILSPSFLPLSNGGRLPHQICPFVLGLRNGGIPVHAAVGLAVTSVAHVGMISRQRLCCLAHLRGFSY